jgi:hypothetical protein
VSAVHGTGTHTPATHNSSVGGEVTIAVSPPVFPLHGGRADTLSASIWTL